MIKKSSKKRNKEFVQQQLYKETVQKVDNLNEQTGQPKAKIYERAVSRFYNSEIKKFSSKEVA